MQPAVKDKEPSVTPAPGAGSIAQTMSQSDQIGDGLHSEVSMVNVLSWMVVMSKESFMTALKGRLPKQLSRAH